MRKMAFSLIGLTILVSCSGDENTQLIFSQKSDSYKIEIATIQTKLNRLGKAQCSKYARTNKNDTVYDSYGLSLPTILAYSLETTEKYLRDIPIDSLHNKYLKVRIDNFSDQPLNYDSVLYHGLSEAFNLEAIPSKTSVEGYQLKVIDHESLERNRVECRTSTIKYNDGVFSGKAVKLRGVAGVVDHYVDSYILRETDDQQCYAIEFIVDSNFDKINHKLKEYGLRFEPVIFEQTFYQINPIIDSSHLNTQ